MRSSPRACRECRELVVIDCELSPEDAVAVVASALLLSRSIRRERCVLARLVLPGSRQYYVFASGVRARLLRPDFEVLAGLARRLLERGQIGGLRLIGMDAASEILEGCCGEAACKRVDCGPFLPWLSIAVDSIIGDRGGACEP